MTSRTTVLPDASAPAVPARPPWALHLAALLLTALNLMTCVGAVYFGTHPDPTRPAGAPEPGSWQAWALIITIVAYALTALVCVPGLYRRSTTAWAVVLGVLAAHVLFGLLKYLGLGEDAAGIFVLVDVAVATLLLTPAVRRYVGGR